MISPRTVTRLCFAKLEAVLDKIFPPAWNPIYQLGGLGFLYYWVVVVSGIYLYILFDTGTTEAYDSIQHLTLEQWYLGGVMRSLHRYGSDGMVLMMVLHTLREWSLGRFNGPRWFTWFTGTPIAWFVIISGISGYWLVWDELAQYVAIRTSEWLDWLGIFGESIARNFLTPAALDDRFFTLLIFIHIVVPLLLLLVLYIHLQRLSRPQINPNRWLAVGTMLMLLVLSFFKPATSQAPADLAMVPGSLDIDWYYLFYLPMIDATSPAATWAFVIVLSLMLMAIPWLPPRARPEPKATVNLANCNGCERCESDCPYNAIQMWPRSDGLPFEREARVDARLCVGCGICAGSCPTATPFRRRSNLVPGIDVADRSIADLRDQVDALALSGNARVMVFACDHGAIPEEDEATGTVKIPCVGALPPSFIDYALSRNVADGVMLAGCADCNCHHRTGIVWTEARIARTRDPHLRARVARDRLATVWADAHASRRADQAVKAFHERLMALPQPAPDLAAIDDLEAEPNA